MAPTAEQVDRWLTRRGELGAPRVDLKDYPGFSEVVAAEPITICVFRADPRPIPAPSEVTTVADGVRVFVRGDGVLALDAIGASGRLADQLKQIPD